MGLTVGKRPSFLSAVQCRIIFPDPYTTSILRSCEELRHEKL